MCEKIKPKRWRIPFPEIEVSEQVSVMSYDSPESALYFLQSLFYISACQPMIKISVKR